MIDDIESVFLITKNQKGKLYYLFDYDEVERTAAWTTNKRYGTAFINHSDLMEFINTHFTNRNDYNFLEYTI